jgi:hypothetical protein
MQLPHHLASLWLLLSIPLLAWLALWVTEQKLKVSLKPLIPWFFAGFALLMLTSLLTNSMTNSYGNKVLYLASSLSGWTCYGLMLWIKRRYTFETLSAPNTKWYLPWKSAEFSIAAPSARVLVRNLDSVLPWYIEKFGFRKVAENSQVQSGTATLRFKVDGNSLVLTTRNGLGTNRTPMLFTKRIDRFRDVLVARGVEVGTVKQDGQGIHYFDIHDPEGNLIEIVEER